MENLQVPFGSVQAGRNVVIAINETKSAVINLAGMCLSGIILPSAFTGTTLTFEASDAEDGTFVPVKKADGNSLSYAVAQATYVIIDPRDFQGITHLKIVSGSSEAAARTLKVSLKGIN